MVETHSYKLSPFGPALQLGGGSSVISANSFWILLAEVPRALDIFGLGFDSLVSGLLSAIALPLELLAPPLPRPVPLPDEPDAPDIICISILKSNYLARRHSHQMLPNRVFLRAASHFTHTSTTSQHQQLAV